MGVVAAVVPWNYPLLMAAWKVAPALAAGNSVILKPAEQSSLSAIRLAGLVEQAGIPAGAFQVLPGAGPVAGRALGLHPDVDCVAFTGSTATGKRFMTYSGESNLKRVWLECGGKSPRWQGQCPHCKIWNTLVESVVEPERYYHNNVIGAMNLLAAMREAGVRNLVFSSTAAVYGDPIDVPIAENHPLRPVNPYGRSKLIMEEIMADYALAYQFDVTALRYFNAAGADPGTEIGEAHHPESHLIPNILRSVLEGGAELKIFGNDYDTPDGTCVRDYIHVCDLAEAHILALDHQRRHPGYFAFNLGNGQGFSILEVIAAAEKVTGRKIAYAMHPRRPGDAARLVADASLARAALNWKPQFTRLEDIVATAWKWHQAPKY